MLLFFMIFDIKPDLNYSPHKFPYKWNLSSGYPAPGVQYNGKKVFSCFSCGGGSTMGYKLAGFNVLGCNEIDPKMMAAYKANHNPKYTYLEPIQTFKLRDDIPQELYELDILDGSPPCSSFSMAGNREKDWGKEKVFREGQSKQILDTLFFDFIDLAKKLQPKIIIAENVKGILLGNAKHYVKRIYKAFNESGYSVRAWLLDASKMGVPQRRERIFFIAMREDLASKMGWANQLIPELDLNFNEKPVLFGEIMEITGKKLPNPVDVEKWYKIRPGGSQDEIEKNGFNCVKAHEKMVLPTITGNQRENALYSGIMHSSEPRKLNINEFSLAGTFPSDYNFIHTEKENIKSYLIGMSVPPVMTAQVAHRIYEQWIKPYNL